EHIVDAVREAKLRAADRGERDANLAAAFLPGVGRRRDRAGHRENPREHDDVSEHGGGVRRAPASGAGYAQVRPDLPAPVGLVAPDRDVASADLLLLLAV